MFFSFLCLVHFCGLAEYLCCCKFVRCTMFHLKCQWRTVSSFLLKIKRLLNISLLFCFDILTLMMSISHFSHNSIELLILLFIKHLFFKLVLKMKLKIEWSQEMFTIVWCRIFFIIDFVIAEPWILIYYMTVHCCVVGMLFLIIASKGIAILLIATFSGL
jgi:hypothetical protein